MNYSTFVIFYTANYCQKIKSFFDVDELIKVGINVEFWDLSEITAHEQLSPVHSKGLKEVKIKTYDELSDNIKRLNNEKCLYLSFVNYAHFSYKVYRILSKYNAEILYATSGILPVQPISRVKRIQRLSKLFSCKNLLANILLKVYKKTYLFNPVKYVLMSCNNASCDYKVSKKTKYISCNSGDFNAFQRLENPEPLKQIVFIDQYTPFHNDFVLRGLRQIPAEKYYRALNEFFSAIEAKYNANIIICAHPSAVKYKEKDFFNGRTIVYNDTAAQIKKSFAVIAQYSTAISFPVINQKPILLITTDDMNTYHSQFALFQRYLSNLLDVPVINIDHSKDCYFKEVDIEAYNSYLHNYLTTPKMKGKYNADVLISIAKGNFEQYIYK